MMILLDRFRSLKNVAYTFNVNWHVQLTLLKLITWELYL